MIAPKLKPGDTVRVIAPSGSYLTSWITDEAKLFAVDVMEKQLGLKVTYGKHLNEIDDFVSSPIEHRLEDLHDAFADPAVKLVICARGGFNSHQLFRRMDWELIGKNPKILCGFSDITALANAIYVKTGLVTYSGPNFFTLGHPEGSEYTVDAFKRCLFADQPFDITSSKRWFEHIHDGGGKRAHENSGMFTVNPGSAEGTLQGANACTLNMLQGTEYFPDLADSVLCLEDDYEAQPHHFNSHLQSLILLPSFSGVKGLVIGRFEGKSGMTEDLIRKTVATYAELKNLPVIAGVDFGHTLPSVTLPIGGRVKLEATGTTVKLGITEH
jgi:muramoyltetrapeptide carboxypeptidase